MKNFIIKLLKLFISIFLKDGEVSSKRVIGVIGMLMVFYNYTYATKNGISLPNGTEFLVGALVSLLGIECITNPLNNLSKSKNGQEDEESTENN